MFPSFLLRDVDVERDGVVIGGVLLLLSKTLNLETASMSSEVVAMVVVSS